MRDFFIILLNWREVAELLHDLAHGLCAVSDPHHVHADNHERNMRRRAVALFNKRGLTMRAADGVSPQEAGDLTPADVHEKMARLAKPRRR